MHKPIEQVQFVVFLKIYKCLIHQIAGKIMLLLVNNVHEKYHRKSRQTLQLRYMRMHSFSANQKRVIFFIYIINMNKMSKLLFFFPGLNLSGA